MRKTVCTVDAAFQLYSILLSSTSSTLLDLSLRIRQNLVTLPHQPPRNHHPQTIKEQQIYPLIHRHARLQIQTPTQPLRRKRHPPPVNFRRRQHTNPPPRLPLLLPRQQHTNVHRQRPRKHNCYDLNRQNPDISLPPSEVRQRVLLPQFSERRGRVFGAIGVGFGCPQGLRIGRCGCSVGGQRVENEGGFED